MHLQRFGQHIVFGLIIGSAIVYGLILNEGRLQSNALLNLVWRGCFTSERAPELKPPKECRGVLQLP